MRQANTILDETSIPEIAYIDKETKLACAVVAAWAQILFGFLPWIHGTGFTSGMAVRFKEVVLTLPLVVFANHEIWSMAA